MFSRIARRYDVANRLLSGGLDIGWRRRLTKAVAAVNPKAILDLATGSGDVAFALSRRVPADVEITGMDFCQPMLDEAKIKQRQFGLESRKIQFLQGDGLNLPCESHTFDAVTISFGLRNMGNRERALAEMNRVLRPGGHLFVLEFSQPNRWFKPIYFFYLRHILPNVAGLLTGDKAAYVYLNDTIEQFPNRESLAKEIGAAGFSQVDAKALTFGTVALHHATKSVA